MWGLANLRNCSHARLVWIGRNETRMLSLMFVAQVNSGTRTAPGEQLSAAFFRDFSGDTVHPLTLQVMDELGLIKGLLIRPHQRLQRTDGRDLRGPLRSGDVPRRCGAWPTK